jgi:ketosteroid isomerase-like protein
MDSSRGSLERAQRAFDELFRSDAGAELGTWFTADGALLWPEMPAIAGPEAIGQAFAEFAEDFATLSFEPRYDLVEVASPLGVVMGSFIETRRIRESGIVERVHGRAAYAWHLDAVAGWRIVRLMTSRYAPTEIVP